MEAQQKYLWLTDTHLLPYNRRKMLNSILDRKPAGVFLTGDISNSSQTLIGDLTFLGERVGRPLFFVMGNHDRHFSSFAKTNQAVRELCQRHPNLIRMDEAGIIPLNEHTCVIGAEGWYDAKRGDTRFLKITFDHFLIDEFRVLPSMEAKIEMFRALAKKSAEQLSSLLEEAMETYKTVFLLTHFPPYPEADRAQGSLMEAFYRPYNTNNVLGEKLEEVMAKYKKRHLIVLCGHTHSPVQIFRSRNIEVRVGRGSYTHLSEDETIYL